MYSFRYGGKTGKRFSLATSDEHVVVRTNNRNSLLVERPFEVAPVSAASRVLLSNFELAAEFREAGVEVLRTKVSRGSQEPPRPHACRSQKRTGDRICRTRSDRPASHPDEVNAPGLVALKNKSPKGTWTLTVADKEKQDTGKIRSFTLEMSF